MARSIGEQRGRTIRVSAAFIGDLDLVVLRLIELAVEQLPSSMKTLNTRISIRGDDVSGVMKSLRLSNEVKSRRTKR